MRLVCESDRTTSGERNTSVQQLLSPSASPGLLYLVLFTLRWVG